jgi:hypothetical protein
MTEFVLVPKEPTEEMLVAGVKDRWGNAVYKAVSKGLTDDYESELAENYKAMLSASPTPPEAQGEGVRGMLEKALHIGDKFIANIDAKHDPDTTEEDDALARDVTRSYQEQIRALIPSIEQREEPQIASGTDRTTNGNIGQP